MNRRICTHLAAALLVNIALFTCYRVLFVWQFAPEDSPALGGVLCSGLRLDAALLGCEFALSAAVLLLCRRWHPARLVGWLAILTGLHAFVCVANFATFAERSQNAGELLLPYITSPRQIYLAVAPFCQQHWVLSLGGLLAAACYAWAAWRLSRSAAGERIDLWRTKRSLALTVLLSSAPLLLLAQPVLQKKERQGKSRAGWSLHVLESKHVARFSQYALNQALLNPLYEFARVQVPAHFRARRNFQLQEDEAVQLWQAHIGSPLDPQYPLLTEIRGTDTSRIENVVIIQVEGLSQSIVDHEQDGRAVTPYLRRLAREGRSFTNTFQNANFTSGGVFSALASVPKATYAQTSKRFASFEMNGYYGSLAHSLAGSNYTHYFCEGFRQSWDDFMSFTARQGCEARGYGHFKQSLDRKGQLSAADTLLGIFDGYFFDEFADLLLACPTRFTAHAMTCTSHSPWVVPSSFKPVFGEPRLDAFAYLDDSIQSFCQRLQRVPKVWETTLIVVLGDHTSVTFSKNPLERLRIPLIFYSPSLPALPTTGASRASQVDVVPTVLGLLPGAHAYAGLGRNLFDPARPDPGIVGGTPENGFFLKDNWVLQYEPKSGECRLLALENGSIGQQDVSATMPELAKQLRREYFAQVELAERLANAKRIFPLPGARKPGP